MHEETEQQVLLPVLLPARVGQAVFTPPATCVNPQSLMRTDLLLLRSLLAQALIYVMNSCLRKAKSAPMLVFLQLFILIVLFGQSATRTLIFPSPLSELTQIN